MKYLLQKSSDAWEKSNDTWEILNADTGYIAGWVFQLHSKGLFQVCNDSHDEIAIIFALEEGIPALTVYYKKNPTRWQRGYGIGRFPWGHEIRYTKYEKWTQYGILCVEQEERGRWRPYRDNCPLMHHDEVAVFSRSTEARRAADAHLRDGYSHSKANVDGFSFEVDPTSDWGYLRSSSFKLAA